MAFQRLLLLSVAAATPVAAECPPEFSGAGEATAFDGTYGYACGLEATNGLAEGFATAIDESFWDGSAHCGECLEVNGPGGTALVRIVELCIGCGTDGLDLYPAAFTAVTGSSSGRHPVTWTRVACPAAGAVGFQLQGSNPYYIKLQVRDHRYGVQSAVLHDGASDYPMSRTSDNHFVATGFPGPVASPFLVSVTATTGQTLLEDVQLVNDTVQAGAGQFQHCTPELFADGFESP